MFEPPSGALVTPYVVTTVSLDAKLTSAATPVAYIVVTFPVSQGYTTTTSPTRYLGGAREYRIYRNGSLYVTIPQPTVTQPVGSPVEVLGPANYTFNDSNVVGGQEYFYSVSAVWGADNATSPASSPAPIFALAEPDTPIPPDPPPSAHGVVKWTFTDVFHKGPAPYTYTFQINPNAGGTPIPQKNIAINYSSGPRVFGIVMEGGWGVPVMSFSGVILDQAQLEALEAWFEQRIMIELHDDLGRKMRGVFSKFNPVRVRRSTRAWYHTYDAEFMVMGYRNASGHDRYVRLVQPGTSH